MVPTNKFEKMLLITPHLSTGGLPQVFYKRALALSKNFYVKIVEYQDLTAGIFTVQKNKIIEKFTEDFITLQDNKSQLFDVIKSFNPKYIHLEEIPELFMSNDIAKILYSNNRSYYITESTHTSTFDVSLKKFLPDKFLHVSKYTKDKFKVFNIESELIEYPIEIKAPTSIGERFRILKTLNLDPNKKHILNVGLFTPGKNQSEIFDIAKEMLNENVVFHFVGNLAGNFSEYWKPLLDIKPKNCVIWNERNDVDKFYKSMDLFLFTSKFELNPIVIKEALSYNMKILMYNLDVYKGKYDNNNNINFLCVNKYDNINKIKSLLRLNYFKYPEKCYVTHTTENYKLTTFGLIDSILEYSEYPIVVFTINFNINDVENPYKSNNNVIFTEYKNSDYPKCASIITTEHGDYVDRTNDSTYKILSMKPKLLLKLLELGIKEGIYLDSDSVCRYNIDDLMNEFKNIDYYPLFTRGVYDVVSIDSKIDVEKPLMDFIGTKNRSMNYVQSNIIVFNDRCENFISDWKNLCENETVIDNFREWAPYQDETIVNVLLWKNNATKHLDMHHFNIRNSKFVEEFEKFDDSDKSKYSTEMLGFPFYINGTQMEWSYIPYEKNITKVFHGIKKYDEMKDIILYQNRLKNDFCIIQTCDDNYKELSKITFENNRIYSTLHGYDYISYTKNINENKSAHWQKYIAIKRHIKNYQWVLFLDADCMIMNYNIKLEDLIDDKYDIIMENMGDRFLGGNQEYENNMDWNYNAISSAMLFKNSKTSINFIRDVYENKKFKIGGIYDNTAVRCLLSSVEEYKNKTKMFPIDSKKLNSTWYTNKPSFLLEFDKSWNDNANIYERGDFILHIVGYDINERISLFKQFVPYIIKEDIDEK